VQSPQDRALVRKLVNYCWRKGMLGYKLDDLQLSITDTLRLGNHKKVCILSSRQIGKSYWACVYALEFLIRHPGKIARIVAPTLEQCHDVVQDNLAKIIEDAPKGFIIRRKSELRWDLINGSSLRLGGLKRAHVDSNRGGNCSLCIYEEAGFTSGDDFNYGVNSVLGPQLLRSKGKEVFISTPSEEPDHPLHTNIKPYCEEIGSFFAYTVYDSPTITHDMIEEAMRRCGGENTEAFRREYLAEIVRSEGLMVVPWNGQAIAPFSAPKESIWCVTVDWGGVRDKTVGLLHSYSFHDDKDMILDEVVFDANTSTRNIVTGIETMVAKNGIRVDKYFADVPGQVQVDLYETHKLSVSIPPKGDWLGSVQTMAARMAANKIMLHPQCKFLIKSCKNGMFNKSRTDFLRTDDLGHCDALAAMMYAIRTKDISNPFTVHESRWANIVSNNLNSDNIAFKKFGKFK
jgi:hypothetical protein